MSKHTEGPWELAKSNNPDSDQVEDRLVYAEIGGEKFHIAEVYQYQNDNHHKVGGTTLANARLIAAAPELLEAAKYAWDNMPSGQYMVRDKLRAAITKATRESEDK